MAVSSGVFSNLYARGGSAVRLHLQYPRSSCSAPTLCQDLM